MKLLKYGKNSDAAHLRIENKLDRAVEDRVPKENIKTKKYEQLVIYIDENDDEYPYYVMRCQEQNVNPLTKKLEDNNSDIDIRTLVKIRFHPNAMKLWDSFCVKYKENIRKSKSSNWFRLKNMTEQEFKRQLKDHSESRLYLE